MIAPAFERLYYEIPKAVAMIGFTTGPMQPPWDRRLIAKPTVCVLSQSHQPLSGTLAAQLLHAC